MKGPWTVANEQGNSKAVDPMAMIASLVEAINAKSAQGGISADQLAQILDNQRKSAVKNNPRHPGISAFSYPEGDEARPKPALLRECFFNGARESIGQLTPGEIEAYNALSRSLPQADTRRLARDGTWKATTSLNNRELRVEVPAKSINDRMDLPGGLTLILMELTSGEQAVSLNAMAQRLAELEAQLKAEKAEGVPA